MGSYTATRTNTRADLFYITVSTATIAVLVLLTAFSAARAETVSAPPFTGAPCHAPIDQEIEAHLRAATSQNNLADLHRSVDALLADRKAVPEGCAARAELSTQIAFFQYRMGDLLSAEKTIGESLAEESLTHHESSGNSGLNHFMLAGVYKVRGDYAKAELEYNKAVEIFSSQQPAKPRALARVYGDMAAMYADRGDMKSAEAALQKSLASETPSNGASATGSIGTRDALVHLAYRRGRLTDALEMLQSMIRDFAEDHSIARELRAHMYRDEGEVLVASHRPAEATEPLRKSLLLTDSTINTPDYAIALAMLSQAYILQKNWTQADEALKEASGRSAGFEKNFPQDAGKILASYGIFLGSQKRWNDSRPLLLRAAPLTESEKDVESAVLQNLIQADHHLHEKEEERAMREKLKSLGSSQPNPARENTVDVLAFNGGGPH